MADGEEFHRHVDHLRNRIEEERVVVDSSPASEPTPEQNRSKSQEQSSKAQVGSNAPTAMTGSDQETTARGESSQETAKVEKGTEGQESEKPKTASPGTASAIHLHSKTVRQVVLKLVEEIMVCILSIPINIFIVHILL